MKQDGYDLRDEYDLSKMVIMPKGRFDPKRRIGMNIAVLAPILQRLFQAMKRLMRLCV